MNARPVRRTKIHSLVPDRELVRRRSNLVSLFRLMAGLTGPRRFGEHELHPRLAAVYRVRVVTVGVFVAVIAVISLVVYGLLPGHRDFTPTGFVTMALLGVVLLAGLILTPWQRLLASHWAQRCFYAWSLYGIFLIGAAAYFSGGGNSAMYLLFPVITVFFAIAYSQRIQLVLYGLCVGAYAIATALHGWNITAADFYIRAATLALVAYVAGVLSAWLLTEMQDRAWSLGMAEQRAGMLDAVARAARSISSLNASQVVTVVLAGAVELGCLDAEVWLLEGMPLRLRLQQRVAGSSFTHDETIVGELFEKARFKGVTQIAEHGAVRLVAVLIHRESQAVGMLLVGMGEAESTDLLLIDCVELLAAQVSAGLDVAHSIAERRDLQERLAHFAFHDSLTDLPNRVLFADRLEHAIARTARDGSRVAVLFLDLDEFKSVNDTMGHAAGDELLAQVALRLQSCLRPNDTLARWGGDEFVVLVDQVEGPEGAVTVAQRIIAALSRPVFLQERGVEVATSIGIALGGGGYAGADKDVLRRADMAMYEAKKIGGSGYVLSNVDISEAELGALVIDPTNEHSN